MAAIRAGHTVAVLQGARETDRDGFLPRVEVRGPVDLAAKKEALHAVLEPANQEHLAVETEAGLPLERRRYIGARQR
jgi:hypothetical protein